MNQVFVNIFAAVVAFVLWAAFISYMWETHWFAGLFWTATPVVIVAVLAARFLRL